MTVGLSFGLIFPINSDLFKVLLKPALMIMLFMVFLKSDIILIFHRIKNFKQVIFLVTMYMIVMPVFFYFLMNWFNENLAVAVLLLVAMPAGAASTVLTDIAGGNNELSASIAITTSLVAPFTVTTLLWVLKIESLALNPLCMLIDLLVFIFIPLIASQVIKKNFRKEVERIIHLFSSINVMILSFSIFLIMGANRHIILTYSLSNILMKLLFLYLTFMALHLIGYLIGYKEDKRGRISTAIGAAYMNNGLAILLAAIYFGPDILIFTILAEIPWNTLLGPFKKVVNGKEKKVLSEKGQVVILENN